MGNFIGRAFRNFIKVPHILKPYKYFSIVKTTILHSPWLAESWIQRNQRFKGPALSYTWVKSPYGSRVNSNTF